MYVCMYVCMYSSEVINAQNIVKEKNNQLLTKIDEIAHYYNFSSIYTFRMCVKKAVVAADFMFELNIFQIFGPRNDILFCPSFVLQGSLR